jgi:hypothetical protein
MLIASIQGCWRVSKRYSWQQGAASWLTPLGSIPSAKKRMPTPSGGGCQELARLRRGGDRRDQELTSVGFVSLASGSVK